MKQQPENLFANRRSSDKAPFLQDRNKRSFFYQVAVIFMVGALSYYLVSNTLSNLDRQAIATGFGFLSKEASFEIGETPIAYSAADTYARALLVGVLNTLKISFVGIILTVLLGTIVGIARLSTNWLIAKSAAFYIEVLQDIPVLLQLFFWYAFFYEILPNPRQALNPVAGVFLSNRGLVLAIPAKHPVWPAMTVAFALAMIGTFLFRYWARRRQVNTGRRLPLFWISLGVILGAPLITWLLYGTPTKMNMPHLTGFNFKGGVTISPEFAALLFGLVLYTSAFVAEIVRAGIQSVAKGQTEAAMAIGLRPGLVLNLVVLPQALRVVIPPLTSQMMNLTKNSSLAVAIGYPDFVSVANTTINQTGQAIEGVALIMTVYLCLSLLTSAFMNWYNKKMALAER